MIRLLFLCFFSLSVNFVFAQFDRWYFGNGGGLVFRNAQVFRLIDGELFTDEACATITDKNGDLLFYTNGVKVWNYKHQIINTVDLMGTKSSTSIAVCLKPGTQNEYYIFTTDEKGGDIGLTYSLLKIEEIQSNQSLERMKSKALYTPDLIEKNIRYLFVEINQKIVSQPVSEKLCLVPHANGKDIWLITHLWNSDRFLSVLITQKGFKDRVESVLGSVHKNKFKTNGSEAIGALKSSHDGKKIASVTSYRDNSPLEIFDFNSMSGKLSNIQSIPLEGNSYGLEFSPDNSKIYVSFLSGPNNLVQVDLSKNKVSPISKKIDPQVSYGALQLAPNGKIYVAKTHHTLDVIDSPNRSAESCGYKKAFISLGETFSVYGLPVKPLVKYEEMNEPIKSVKEAVVSNKEKSETTSNHLKNQSCNLSLRDTVVRCLPSFELHAGGRDVAYEWSTKEKTESIVVKESNYYSVTATGAECRELKKVYVKFEAKPTNFSHLPEFNTNAAFNNYFAYSINDVKEFSLTVYGSSNKIIFETKDPKEKWKGSDKNGKMVKPGKYNWEAMFIPKCSEEKQIKKGEVTVK